MDPIQEEEMDLPLHQIDHHMDSLPNPRGGQGGRHDHPNRHASANNTYSISSAMTGADFDTNSRLALLIRQEAESKVFLRLKLKPLISPFHVVCYYLMMFTMGILLQFIMVHMTLILQEQYNVDQKDVAEIAGNCGFIA